MGWSRNSGERERARWEGLKEEEVHIFRTGVYSNGQYTIETVMQKVMTKKSRAWALLLVTCTYNI